MTQNIHYHFKMDKRVKKLVKILSNRTKFKPYSSMCDVKELR